MHRCSTLQNHHVPNRHVYYLIKAARVRITKNQYTQDNPVYYEINLATGMFKYYNVYLNYRVSHLYELMPHFVVLSSCTLLLNQSVIELGSFNLGITPFHRILNSFSFHLLHQERLLQALGVYSGCHCEPHILLSTFRNHGDFHQSNGNYDMISHPCAIQHSSQISFTMTDF